MNILHFALNDLKLTVKQRVAFALILIMPIFMIALMGYVLKPVFNIDKGIEKFPMLYANEDDGTIGQSLDDFFYNQVNNLVETVESSPEDVEAKVASGDYAVAVIVPKDLSDRILKGEPASIDFITSGKDPIKEGVVRSLLNSFSDSIGSQIQLLQGYLEVLPNTDPAEAQAVISAFPNGIGTNFIQVQTVSDSITHQLTSFEFFAASMLIFFLLTSGMGIGSSLLKEREEKTFMRISSFPITRTQYLLGKIVANVLIGVLQSLFIILFARYAFEVNWGNNYLGIALTIILVVFISCAIGILFSAFAKSSKALTSSMTIVFWLMTFISGGFTASPLLDPLPKLTVNKWAFDALTTMMTGGRMDSILTPLIVLAAAALILWTAGILFYNRRVSHE